MSSQVPCFGGELSGISPPIFYIIIFDNNEFHYFPNFHYLPYSKIVNFYALKTFENHPKIISHLLKH